MAKIQRFSLHDGPGIRTTVFLKGCPLSCIWCQNPETIEAGAEVLFSRTRCIKCKRCIKMCPEGCFSGDENIIFKADNCHRCGICVKNCPVSALRWIGEEISSEAILTEAMRDKLYYDVSGGGITLSGGEPLQQREFCYEIASKAKKSGVHVAVDTAGYVEAEVFKRMMPVVDLFLFDIKFIDDKLHEEYTTKPNRLILDNFKRLCRAKKDIRVRVPLAPGITDTKKNISQIADFVKSCSQDVEIEYVPFNYLLYEKYKILGKKSKVKNEDKNAGIRKDWFKN